MGLLGLGVLSVPGRRAFWAMVVTGLVTVALLSVWRLATFADVVPNTIWAKLWPPYPALSVADRLAGAVELPSFFVGPAIALGIAARSGLSFAAARAARGRALAIVAAPIAGAVIMGLLTGRHWGYYGRMPYFAFPPALLLLSLLFSDWVAAARSRFRIAVAVGSLASAVAVSMVGFPSGSLDAAFKGGELGVTPHTYAASGRVFRRFAAAAELEQPTILTSDVGGLALCCDEFKIVDLAFLSNRTLAARGRPRSARCWRPSRRIPSRRTGNGRRWDGCTTCRVSARATRRRSPTGRGSGSGATSRGASNGAGAAAGCPQQQEDLKRALKDHRYAMTDVPDDRTSFERQGAVFTLDDPGCAGSVPTFGNFGK